MYEYFSVHFTSKLIDFWAILYKFSSPIYREFLYVRLLEEVFVSCRGQMNRQRVLG
jgi:hypothetical protein